MDTTTPTGRMIFTVLGAVAELERSLIVERLKAGLRNARTKGKRLGRPRSIVGASKVARQMGLFQPARPEGRGKIPRDFRPMRLQILPSKLRLWQKQMI